MEKSRTRNGRALAILTKSHLALVELLRGRQCVRSKEMLIEV